MRTDTSQLFFTVLLATALALTSACSGDDTTGSGPNADTGGTDATGEGGDATGEGSDATGSEGDIGDDPTEDGSSGPGHDVVDTPAGCSAEETATLTAMDWGQILGACAETCMFEGATDVEGCGDACVAEATGVSETCSACFGSFLSCAQSECAEMSEDPDAPAAPCPGGEACQECVSNQCDPALMACTGIGPQGTTGCTNQEDQTIIMSSLETMFDTCAPPCLEAENPGACLEVCTMQIGLSDGCGMCFYNYGECTVTSCSDVCTPDTVGDPACQACIDTSCGAAFAECAGFALSGGPACTNPADAAIMDGDDDPMDACGNQCMGGDDAATCMAECLATAGFSDACSDCLGGFSTCVASNCAGDCTAGDDAACDSCIGAFCMAQAVACFGMDQGGPPDEEALCGGEGDTAALTADAMLPQTCAMTCAGDADPGACITTCLEAGGLTEGCSNCVSWMLGCVFENCNEVCMDPDQAQACGTCTATSCGEATTACFGEGGGSTTGPPDPGDDGICSMDDSSIMMADKADEVCGMQCFEADEQAQCISDCMTGMGISLECSNCMADVLVCVVDNCMAVCMAQDPDCDECIDANCASQSAACFGGNGDGDHP
jgi:hypothetical protein